MDRSFHARLTGKLLGDGCITKQPNRQPRFQFMHRKEDIGWSSFCYEQLKHFLPLNPPAYKKVIDQRTKAGFTESFVVQSRSDSKITYLEKLWYKNRKKQLPLDFIQEYLTEEALAWWYQDDGHLQKSGSVPKKIVLSTDSFSENERKALQSLLYKIFSLEFKEDNQRRLLLYDQPQIYYFLHLVAPFIQPCMARKQLPLPQVAPSFKPKRTTIYLPESISIKKPTAEINEAIRNGLPNDQIFHKQYQSISAVLKSAYKQKAYQIVLSPENQQRLYRSQIQTGWTTSQLVYVCFKNLH